MFKTNVFVAACAASAFGVFAPCAVSAQDVAPGHAPPSRYVMEKTGNGIVRMDTATGEMILCREDQGKIACRMADGERHALQQRIDRLEARVSKLETALADLKGEAKPLPSDKDLDRTMDAFDRLMRHFFKMVENLSKDLREQPGTDEGSAGTPQKT